MKLSKTKDMFEYNWYLEEHINQNYLKINKLINIVINIFMVIFLLCFKKVGLISYCFYFLICDMCLTIIDIISISVYKSIDKVFWFFHKIAFSYELKEMSLSEIEKYKNEFSESNAFYQKKIDMLNKQIEEYNKLDNMSYMNKNQYDITYVKDMMTRFKSYNSLF